MPSPRSLIHFLTFSPVLAFPEFPQKTNPKMANYVRKTLRAGVGNSPELSGQGVNFHLPSPLLQTPSRSRWSSWSAPSPSPWCSPWSPSPAARCPGWASWRGWAWRCSPPLSQCPGTPRKICPRASARISAEARHLQKQRQHFYPWEKKENVSDIIISIK